jgi:YebC/PmpR family DNA-binding regulatory protein
MAGHSKWKNIQHRKGKQDALRGNLFTKLSREIIVAAKAGGGDRSGNARLRVAIDKARAASMPVDNIDRAIQRGTGQIEGADYDEITYEGYGPGGVAVIVETYTENRTRTVADVRHAFTKCGGSLGENGSVGWQFKRVGHITVQRGTLDEDEFTLAAIDAGAEDVQSDEESFTVETAVENLHSTNEALVKAGFQTEEIELTYVPTNMATPDADAIPKLLRLLDMLEDLDDVKETHINFELTEEMLEKA